MGTAHITQWKHLTCTFRHVVSCHVPSDVVFVMSSYAPHATRCIQHDIHVLNLPANLTHILQVPDVSVFGPFKTLLAKSMVVRQHEGQSVVQPWEVAADANILAGFKKAGIWHFDPSVITPTILSLGPLFRKQVEADKENFPLHIPQPTLAKLDHFPSSSTSSSSSRPILEPVRSILAPPVPFHTPTPSDLNEICGDVD